MTYLGIDPGQKGGLCLLSGSEVKAWRMPDSASGLLDLLRECIPKPTVILEKAQPMPKQGVSSVFSYGQGYGQLLGIIAALELRYHEIRPTAWKKVVLAGEADKSDKGTSIRVAERLFPTLELIPAGCRKPHDGMAEAALLAEYGRRLNL